MKTIILLVLLLSILLAVEVGAQTSQLNHGKQTMCQAQEGGPWYPARPNGMCYSADEQSAPCLAQMEAAMRAMDAFVAPMLQLNKQGRVSSLEQEFEATSRQWESAKRACWKEKP